MSRNCNHATCGATCRRPKAQPKARTPLKRTPLARKAAAPLRRTPIKKDPSYRLPKVSGKREVANAEYFEQSKRYIEQHPICAILSPVCTTFAQAPNHIRGKATIELLLNKRFWEPACNACNGFIEQHHAWAAENGHRLPNYLPEDVTAYTKHIKEIHQGTIVAPENPIVVLENN